MSFDPPFMRIVNDDWYPPGASPTGLTLTVRIEGSVALLRVIVSQDAFETISKVEPVSPASVTVCGGGAVVGPEVKNRMEGVASTFSGAPRWKTTKFWPPITMFPLRD